MARKYLYLAALRLVKDEPLARRWYEAKVQRDGGKCRKKALIAVTRKLARALWWVGQGDPFDPAKLFNANRLAPITIACATIGTMAHGASEERRSH